MIKAAIMGYGTVGSGVFRVLETNASAISAKIGEDLSVKYVLDLREFPGDPVQDRLVHDFDVLLNDPEVCVVAETLGGLHPAYEFTKKLLEAGKSVCTSNKELVAAHGYELMRTARLNNANYLFEASCGGGIPVIRTMQNALTGDIIEEVAGILNGTTNYILTKMEREGAAFEDVLKEAQQKGYAELHPEADVEGYDAARKIAILSSVAYGALVDYQDVYTEGISKITGEDIKYAAQVGARIKLLGISRETEKGYTAMVAPFLVGKEDPLYNVNDVFNAIVIESNMLGESMYYGRGAGKLPTASAVAGDLVACAKSLGTSFTKGWENRKLELVPHEEGTARFFVRVKGLLAVEKSEVELLFGAKDFVVNKEIKGEFAFFTKEMTEAEFEKKAKRIPGMVGRIRVKL